MIARTHQRQKSRGDGCHARGEADGAQALLHLVDFGLGFKHLFGSFQVEVNQGVQRLVQLGFNEATHFKDMG